MGLFDKKYCDVCGEKIGLLGNRKLDDGNLCKDCARKLSPFFNDRRHATVDDIKAQLAYREENERNLSNLHPTHLYGKGTRVFIDSAAGKFVVNSASDWKSGNPDIIDISQVIGCDLDINEHKNELYTKDKDGNRISYNPPRFEYEYSFDVKITVNSPWFSEIEFELSDDDKRPTIKHNQLYRDYEDQFRGLKHMLSADDAPQKNVIMEAPAVQSAPVKWKCPGCDAENEGAFCEFCGTKRP